MDRLLMVLSNTIDFLRACFFFQAEDGIRDYKVTGVQTCALPIYAGGRGLGGDRRTPASSRRTGPVRSEERRVGKECRSRWSAYHQKKKRTRQARWGVYRNRGAYRYAASAAQLRL